ncbi:chemotaxis protein CheW [Spirochaeta dissipatitropha]
MAVQNKDRRRTRLGHIDRAEEEQRELIDFKMVTFSLGGKDYGIDIMKVKEIAKYSNFTYVPNAPRFVEGVYNLRGDIISIVDLRKLFHLPVEEDNQKYKNGLILRLETNLLGIIVDKIDKVIGISSKSIQPPHPIFGDINIKFISGVVEHEKRLYIILDVERIFRKDDEVQEAVSEQIEESIQSQVSIARSGSFNSENVTGEELNKSFIYETLGTFSGFHLSGVNKEWVDKRFAEWQKFRKDQGKSVQLETQEDASEFLRSFYSPYTQQLWGDGYREQVRKFIPTDLGKTITVWNPGCANGMETFSLVCLLKNMYPESMIKVWAVDKDLMAISAAPSIQLSKDSVPAFYHDFMVQGTKGQHFDSSITDSVLFEYSDIANGTNVPACDIILCRDLLSFLPEAQQKLMDDIFVDKLKQNGVLFMGKNEYPFSENWNYIGEDAVSAARKK